MLEEWIIEGERPETERLTSVLSPYFDVDDSGSLVATPTLNQLDYQDQIIAAVFLGELLAEKNRIDGKGYGGVQIGNVISAIDEDGIVTEPYYPILRDLEKEGEIHFSTESRSYLVVGTHTDKWISRLERE